MKDLYFPISTGTWRDPEMKALSRSAQGLFWYLCSIPSRSACGVVLMNTRQWLHSAADYSQADLDADLDELTEHGFIVVDDDTGEVLIPSWIDRDGCWKASLNMRAAGRAAREIESEALRRAMAQVLRGIDTSKVRHDRVGDRDGKTEKDRVEEILTDVVADLDPDGDIQIYDLSEAEKDSTPDYSGTTPGTTPEVLGDSVPNPLQDPVKNPLQDPVKKGSGSGARPRTRTTSTSTSTSTSGARSASACNSPQSARARNTTSADAPATTDEPGQLFANNTVDITTGEVLTGTPEPQATDPWEAAAIEQHPSQPAHYGQTPPAFARAQAKTHRRPKTTETDEQEETRVLHIIQRCDYDQLKKACKDYSDVIGASEQLRDAVGARMAEVHPQGDDGQTDGQH